ncbi:hypothetical protein MHF_1431 [Mycoplasma haemofelis Ohio2]|uniref:Lipoprotein n=1 Tax=Mycoplasma haemofelis (strain Ohio2) TaxID=859194 RepID=F6FGM7_MYCHI|nr:hypothetical protein MHF_1431 [Mycoplasma haemofelis Ohio2]
MDSLLVKSLLLVGGTSAVGCSTAFLEYDSQLEPTPTVKTSVAKAPSKISGYEDIIPFQKSKGCNFWFVETWSEKKIAGPTKLEKILLQERPNGDKNTVRDKEKKLFEYLNSIATEHCKDGKHLTIHYKEGKQWELHNGT